MVCSDIQLRMCIQTQKPKLKKFNVGMLKLPHLTAKFQQEVGEKVSQIDNVESIDSIFDNVNATLISVGSELLTTKQNKLGSWVSAQTLELVTRRRTLPRNQRHKRRDIDHAIKVGLKNDREAYWQNIAAEMENANRAGNTRKLYQLIRKCTGKSSSITDAVKRADGSVASSEADKMKCWAEHFSNLLNAGPTVSDASDAEFSNVICDSIDCSVEAPSLVEIKLAIKKLKNNKSPGEDSIPPEFYKVAVNELAVALHKLFKLMWIEDKVPSQWGLSHLIPLHKKGDKMLCSNYRGISLLDISLKIFESILLNRFQPLTEPVLRENQAGFRPGRGCADQIFSLRMMMSKCIEFQQLTYLLFVDFKAAFDSVDRSKLWKVLRQYGIPDKIITMFKALYDNTRCAVRVNDKLSEDFKVNTGVRQGAIASPVLFNFVIDWVMRKAVESCTRNNRKVGISLGNKVVTDFDYADDIALMAGNESDMQFFVDKICFFGKMVGLCINPDKSKVMSICTIAPCKISVYGSELENVDSFRYLGSLLSADGCSDRDIVSRIGFAQASFQQLYPCFFSRKDISIQLKVRVYMASVRSVFLYGCESWAATDSLCTLLERCELSFLRRILDDRSIPRTANCKVRHVCQIKETLSQTIIKRRLTWLGHVLRMKDDRIPKYLLLEKTPSNWRRERGRPHQTWDRIVHSETLHLTNHVRYTSGKAKDWMPDGKYWLGYLGDLASSRNQWRDIVNDIVNNHEQ